jgi:hypothetical protein
MNGSIKMVQVRMKKTVNIQLPQPYSPCSDTLNVGTSFLVKELLQQNITYRKKNCFQLCHDKFLDEYAAVNNVTYLEAFDGFGFDYRGNCSHLCPWECQSSIFEIFQHEEIWKDEKESLLVNFFFSDLEYTKILQTVKTTSADLISNTGGVLGLFLELSFWSTCRFILFIFDFVFV